MNAPANKAELRALALAYRAGLSAHERHCCSEQIIENTCCHLQRQATSIRSLLTYRAMVTEVDTSTLLHLPQYRIFAPVTHRHDQMQWLLVTPQTRWKKGLFGILEPASGPVWQKEEATVLLCPLTAFDRQGNRLGMGKGCFDYWLSSHRQSLYQVIGLAFAGQEVAQIPAERHDAPLDCIITEKEVIQCPTV